MVKVNNKTIITTGLLAILLFNNISVAFALVGNSTINSMSGVDSVTHNAATQTTNITTNNAVNTSTINWQTLNVGKTETLDVNFTRGSQTLLNNVVSGMTTVAGQILSTGIGADSSRIIISNPNGILLDKGSYINANAFMLTTLGVDVQNSLIQLSQKNGSVAAPNTGIVIKGKIDTNDLAVVSRGIVLDGADIFANGNVSLVTAEGATFQIDSLGKTNLTNTIAMSAADRSKVSVVPSAVKYADKVARADNITLKSNTAIRSKDGKIYLSDQRMNTGGINIGTSTLTAKNGINIDSTNYTKIATLKSDADTLLTIKAVANPYKNTGLVSISGIDTIKGVKIQSDLKNQSGNYFTEGQSASLTSVKAKDGGINIEGFKKATISTSDSTGNVAVKGAADISVTGLTNEAQTDLTSTNSTIIKNSFLRALLSDTKTLTVSNTQLDQVNLNAAVPTSTFNISTLSGYADKNNTVALNTTGTFASAYVAAKAGNSLKVGNINTSGNISLNATDINQTAGSTLNTTVGTVAMTATNALTHSNINSNGTVTLKGKDITGNNGSTVKSAIGNLSLTATNNLDVTGAELTATKGTTTLSGTNSLKAGNVTSYGNISLTGKDVSNTTKSSLTSTNGSITETASNYLQAFNLKAAQNITLKGNNLLIVTNAATPKTVTLTSNYKNNIHQNNVTSTKITLSGKTGTPPSNATQIEADRLAKVEADRPAAEAAEAARLAKIEADRLAKIEADIIAEEARLAKIAEDARLAKIEADRIAEEARLAKIAEDARLAKIEADRIAEEDRLAKIAEDARLAKIEADRIAEEDRLAKIAEADRLAKIEADRITEEARLAAEKAEKDRLAADQAAQTAQVASNSKASKIDTKMGDSSLPSQLAQNVKGLAADEQPAANTQEARVIHKTATGFSISKKITR